MEVKSMNLSTFLVLAVVVALVIADIRYICRKGGFIKCAGDCGTCGGSCHWSKDLQKAKRDIEREKQHELRKSL